MEKLLTSILFYKLQKIVPTLYIYVCKKTLLCFNFICIFYLNYNYTQFKYVLTKHCVVQTCQTQNIKLAICIELFFMHTTLILFK